MPSHGSPPKIRTSEADEPVHDVGQPITSHNSAFIAVVKSPTLTPLCAVNTTTAVNTTAAEAIALILTGFIRCDACER
jgi:hypothetical protein